MSYLLHSYEWCVSKCEMNCDASKVFWDFHFAHKDEKVGMKEINIMMATRSLTMPPNTRYLHFDFLDTDSGELLEFNAWYEIHKFMIEKKRYPPFMQRAFEDYKTTHQ